MTPNKENATITPQPETMERQTPASPTNGFEPTPERHRGALLFAAIVLALAAAVVYFGIRSRSTAESRLKQRTEEAAIPVVAVVFPKEGAATDEIVLPGVTQALIDSPIYARTNGYLLHWYFDIGAHVKKDQLLAVIDTPEIDQQLQQARGNLDTAQANVAIAKITADRWQGLVSDGSVSQQQTDQAVINLKAVQATLEANAANVRRLERLQSFEKVYAPFDGIITARSTDIGALIDAGSAAQSKELFHMAAISTLRVFVPVPEVYSNAARPGAAATLTLDEYPGRVFHGTLVRDSSAIDPASRTLLVEVDVANPDGLLLPGAYVSVHLKLPATIRSVTIPANTLLFRREGLRVGVVRGGRANLVPVAIGRDYGANVEIVSGLRPADSIILDPSDSLENGSPVHVQQGGAR